MEMINSTRRKQLRLQNYNYSSNGAYFITICVDNGDCLLGKIVHRINVGVGVLDDPCMVLSDCGEIVRKQIDEMASFYSYLDIPKYVIMPNHIHMIVMINAENGSSGTPTPTNATIPRFVSTLKRFTNKKAKCSIWQRAYHERIIRNDEAYAEIWQYIDTNPLKWELDKYYKIN